MFRILHNEARSILSDTSGFIASAGFTHSLTPARNCTYGCTYCYVPTMRIYGGLKREDWEHWGQFTTFKDNAPDLLRKQLRSDMVIYCSPLVDPYQPAERSEQTMPKLYEVLLQRPPRVFVIQTRGPLILRDLHHLSALARRTTVRVSFSITTNREDVRRWFEPHCEPNEERLRAIAALREAGIETYATLAPLLPCDPDALAEQSLLASGRDLIGDPLHVRPVKRHGATTREQAFRIARVRGFQDWLQPGFQEETIARIKRVAACAGRRFLIGPAGFSLLSNHSGG